MEDVVLVLANADPFPLCLSVYKTYLEKSYFNIVMLISMCANKHICICQIMHILTVLL